MVDVWSNGNMAAFLGLTAYWIHSDRMTGCLSLKAVLIGFNRLKKRHTGRNITRTIPFLLDRAGVTAKVFLLKSMCSDVNLQS